MYLLLHSFICGSGGEPLLILNIGESYLKFSVPYFFGILLSRRMSDNLRFRIFVKNESGGKSFGAVFQHQALQTFANFQGTFQFYILIQRHMGLCLLAGLMP